MTFENFVEALAAHLNPANIEHAASLVNGLVQLASALASNPVSAIPLAISDAEQVAAALKPAAPVIVPAQPSN